MPSVTHRFSPQLTISRPSPESMQPCTPQLITSRPSPESMQPCTCHLGQYRLQGKQGLACRGSEVGHGQRGGQHRSVILRLCCSPRGQHRSVILRLCCYPTQAPYTMPPCTGPPCPLTDLPSNMAMKLYDPPHTNTHPPVTRPEDA